MTERPGTYREADGEPVAMAAAKETWTPLAREALVRTARVYHEVINYGELAEEVQDRSGIRTRQLLHYWIGDVLGRVSRECHRCNEPLLSALCVQQDGHIGDGYAWVLAETKGGAVPTDLDVAAAEERLECYRYFGAALPPDGGQPALTPQVAAERRSAKRRAREAAPRPVCPMCFIELPASGECGYCN